MIDYLSSFIYDPKITEEDLISQGIKILKDCYIEISDKEFAKCRTGNFYYGKYENQNVIIKKVNIGIDDEILNEFIFWQKQIDMPYYLKMKGIYFKKYFEVYVVFDDYFTDTIESKLKSNTKFSNQDKMKVVGQLITALNYFKKENTLNLNLRSGTIGLDENYKIKFLEVDSSVLLKTEYNSEIYKIRKKYSPPEFYYNAIVDETFDNYSFGVILQDLFISSEKNCFKKNQLNCLLNGIILRCTEKKYEERIKIDELSNNFKEFYDYYFINQKNDNYISNEDKIFENESNFKEFYNYSKNLKELVNSKNEDIKVNMEKKIKNMKLELTKAYENTLPELEKIKKEILEKLNSYLNTSINIVNSFYDKIINSTLNMQTDLSNTVNDLLEVELIGDGMLSDLKVFSKFINKNKYENIKTSLTNSREKISKIIKKNSRDTEFDLINKIYNNNYPHYERFYSIINEYKNQYNNLFNFLKELEESNEKKKNQELDVNFELEKAKNYQLLNKKLSGSVNSTDSNENLNHEIPTESKLFNSMTESIYAKIEEKSNNIFIYNSYLHKITKHPIQYLIDNNINFNSKTFSYFDKSENCIYVSGGLIDDNKDNFDNSMIKISITFNKKNSSNEVKNEIEELGGEYIFEVTILSPMKIGRSSHNMLRLNSNNNLFVVMGGKNTTETEVFNMEQNVWVSVGELPCICVNPVSMEFNNCIYLFNSNYYGLDSVFCLDMNKNENFVWNKIEHKMEIGNLKRAMNIVNYDDNIYILGGFDNNKEYSDIYNVNVNEKEGFVDINYCKDIVLKNDCSFNSNSIILEKINEGDDKKMLVIMMDTMNGVSEINFKSGMVDYYSI